MHRRLLAPLLFLLLATMAPTAVAGELTPSESAALRQDVQGMLAAFARGDAELIIARTHPSLKRLAGGDEVYARSTRDTVKALHEAGVTIISDEAGVPTRTYAAGDEEVCFVPRYSCCAYVNPRSAAPRSWSPCAASAPRNGAIWMARGCSTTLSCSGNCCQRWSLA